MDESYSRIRRAKAAAPRQDDRNSQSGRDDSRGGDELVTATTRSVEPPRESIESESAAEHIQLAEVLDAATQVSICATDVDGTITLFNSGAEKMLGFAASEMVGKRTPAVMHLASEVEERGQQLSRELGRDIHGFEVFVASAKAGKFERREWTYVRKDGRHLTVNLVVTAVRNPCGEITGFLGVAEDISERQAIRAGAAKK